MQAGIDSYCYHRLFGDVRVGEQPVTKRWQAEIWPPLAHATQCGADWLFLETCFLPDPDRILHPSDVPQPSPRLGFSWGHGWPEGRPHGLHGGRRPDAMPELLAWIDTAGRLGQPLLRVTAGSPATRRGEATAPLLARLAPLLRYATNYATERGVALALENHGDLRAHEILELIERVDHRGLGVCLDNVNLIRVGDEMIEGARLLAEVVSMVQLKDCLDGDPAVPGGPVSTALGEGTVDLRGILGILAGAGFDGPVCVELAALGPESQNELAMVERSLAWLRTYLPGGASNDSAC